MIGDGVNAEFGKEMVPRAQADECRRTDNHGVGVLLRGWSGWMADGSMAQNFSATEKIPKEICFPNYFATFVWSCCVLYRSLTSGAETENPT